MRATLTLFFFLLSASAAFADQANVSLAGYLSRVAIALVVLAIAGFLATRYLPGRAKFGTKGVVKVVSAINIDRGTLYVLRIGPEVVALYVSKSGAQLLCRWSSSEWEDYQAAEADMSHLGMKNGE